MKKLLSLILTLSMLLGITPVALASNQSTDVEVLGVNEIAIQVSNNSNLRIRTEELANGDIFLSMFENQTTLSTSYIDRANNVITDTDYRTDVPTITTTSYEPEPLQSIPTAFASTKMGRIGYSCYFQDSIVNTTYLDVSYTAENGSQTSYNVAGHYASLLAVVSLLLAVFSLPISATAGATLAATRILAKFGFGVAAASFTIGFLNVEADWYKMIWNATNPNGSGKATLSGVKYVFSFAGYDDLTQFDGSYYPTSSYSSHNNTFARELFRIAFSNYDRCDVISWT